MAYPCPYLKERGYKEYYCELKDEYVDEKTYENHCYGVMAERYLNCPTYDYEEHQRELYGKTRLKGNKTGIR